MTDTREIYVFLIMDLIISRSYLVHDHWNESDFLNTIENFQFKKIIIYLVVKMVENSN